jgi:hypothetical protein
VQDSVCTKLAGKKNGRFSFYSPTYLWGVSNQLNKPINWTENGPFFARDVVLSLSASQYTEAYKTEALKME